MTLTLEIAEFLSEQQFATASASVKNSIMSGFTDCVAVMVAGGNEPITRHLQTFVTRTAPAEARIFSNGSLASASDAALVNGAAAHVLDYDDTGLNGHPSAVLVPTVLAAGEAVGADGTSAIAAYLAGYEVWAALISREADQLHDKGWHPTAVYGVVAAAASAVVLYRLDRRAAANAIGLAASHACGVVANFGSMTKALHVGRAAQNGIQAAQLAALGVTSSVDALEHGRGFLRAVSPRGNVDLESPSMLGILSRFEQSGLNLKLYPMCYGVHRSLDGVLELLARTPIQADKIRSVDVHIGETAASVLRSLRPKTALEAKFSMQFAMAAAVIAGRCTNSELTDEFVSRGDVQNFFDRVHVHTMDEVDIEEPIQSPFALTTITLEDGTSFQTNAIRHPRGHNKNPASIEDLKVKFYDCVSPRYGDAITHTIFEQLQNMGSLKSLKKLSALLELSPRNSRIAPEP